MINQHRRLAVVGFAILTAFLTSNAIAQPMRPGPSLIDVSVVPRNTGTPLQEYYYENNYYIAGNQGEVYDIVVTNKTRGRIKTVISVDGLNVISGKTASWTQEGYVLAPFESARITGWRKSMTETAQFYFAALSDSYSARVGKGITNVGVIGVAVMEEDIKVIPFSYSQKERMSTLPAPGMEANSASADKSVSAAGAVPAPAAPTLGTGHGAREESEATRTTFKALPRPSQVWAVYYDSYNNLVRKGVIQERRRPGKPNPFPENSGFAPDPRY